MKMKMMLSCAALVLGVGMVAAIPAMAQDDAAAPPPAAEGHGHHGHKGGPVAGALEGITLTADQQTKVDAAEADAQTKMKAAHDDTTTTDPKAKRKQAMEIQKAEADQVRAALTDDQKTQFDAKMADMRAKMKAKRDAAGGGAGATAPEPTPAEN